MFWFICFHKSRVDMSDYNWCHGPKCHNIKHTRVRGVKGSKVLRTRKDCSEQLERKNMFGHTFVVKVV